MEVININGTSRFTVPKGYDSWLDYWEKQTGLSALKCGCGFVSLFNLVTWRKFHWRVRTIMPIEYLLCAVRC